MYNRSAVNYLMSYKNFECLLRRNFSVETNQTCRKPTKCFLSTFRRSNTCNNIVNPRFIPLTLSWNSTHLKLMTCRNFSTSQKLFNNGSNDKEDRQVKIMIFGLGIIVVFCFTLGISMEHHQDYVVIQPNEK